MSEITQGLIDLNGTLPIQIINFLILVALLRAVAYKPIVRMMDERKAKIAESIEKADADAAAAEATLNEYKAQLAAARTKAQEIVDMAEKRAGEEREASIQATKREIEQMKASARAEIARENERAKDEIRKEVIRLSLLAAGKIVAKNMTTDENETFVENFIDSLDKDKIGELPC